MPTSPQVFIRFAAAFALLACAQQTPAHDQAASASAQTSHKQSICPHPNEIAKPGEPQMLVQGTQIGKTIFPPGDTKQGGNGQTIDGIEGSIREMLQSHTHSHLALFHNGKRIAIPRGIGIVQPHKVKKNFVTSGKGFYWLHTHDATGIIHVESPDGREFKLGTFFNIWGRPLDAKNVAGLKGEVRAFVDGKPYDGDVRDIVLAAHTLITLYVGEKTVEPPVYSFPEGL